MRALSVLIFFVSFGLAAFIAWSVAVLGMASQLSGVAGTPSEWFTFGTIGFAVALVVAGLICELRVQNGARDVTTQVLKWPTFIFVLALLVTWLSLAAFRASQDLQASALDGLFGGLAFVLLPAMALRWLLKGSLWLWRVGAPSGWRTFGGLVASAILACVSLAVGAVGYAGGVRAGLFESSSGSARTPVDVSSEAEPPAGVHDDRFNQCAEELSHQSEGRTALDEATQAMMTQRRMPSEMAEDVVYSTLLKVCLRFSTQDVGELRPYFFKALFNNAKKQWRYGQQWQFCSLYSDDWILYGDRDQIIAMRNAVCRLSQADQELVELFTFRGLDYAELAERYQTTPPAMRQRISRIRKVLRRAL